MDLSQRMDVELIAAYQEVPVEGLIDWEDLPATREFFAGMLREMTADIPDSENVVKEDRSVPGPEGAPEVPVRVYRPVGNRSHRNLFKAVLNDLVLPHPGDISEISRQLRVDDAIAITVKDGTDNFPEDPRKSRMSKAAARALARNGQVSELVADER